ncbi:MAG: GGDEF domain-containing protein [Succinivibrionaceae bacterium]
MNNDVKENISEISKDKKIAALENELSALKSIKKTEDTLYLSIISKLSEIFFEIDKSCNEQVQKSIEEINKNNLNNSENSNTDILNKLYITLKSKEQKMKIFLGAFRQHCIQVPKLLSMSTSIPDDIKNEVYDLQEPNIKDDVLKLALLTTYLVEKFIHYLLNSEKNKSDKISENIFSEIKCMLDSFILDTSQKFLINENLSKLEEADYNSGFLIVKEILKIIIDGANKERDSTTYLLTTINEHINVIQSSFSRNIDTNKKVAIACKTNNQHLSSEIINLEKIFEDPDVLDLSKVEIVRNKIANLQELSNQRNSFINIQDKLLSNLSDIEHKISFIQNETFELKENIAEKSSYNKLDLLTQLNNRYSFEQQFNIDINGTDQGLIMSVLYIDIDNFKLINNKYNQAVGDKILKVLALTLKKSINDFDFVARLYSDQFGLIIHNNDPKYLNNLINKIITSINSIPFHYKEEKVDISVSIVGAILNKPINLNTVIQKLQHILSTQKDEHGLMIVKSFSNLITLED